MAYIKIPRNEDAEKALLGSILLRPMAITDIIEDIKEDSFYNKKNSVIFNAISLLFKDGDPIDLVSVSEKLQSMNLLEQSGGVSYLNTIANDVPSSNNIEYYAKVVKDKYLRRNMMDAADRLRDSVQDDDIDSIESISAAISSLTDGLAIGGTNPDASHSLDMLKQSIDEFKASTNGLLGVSTGIGELDDKIYGMRSGHFGVLSAYSSTGKSAFALNMVASFIKQGKKVVFFSLEMSGAEIMARLISIISGVPTWVVQRGCSDDSQKELVLNAIKLIKDSGMRTYTDSSWNTIQMTMLKESVGNKADMFVLDYIQLVTSEEKSDYARLSRVAKELQKNLQRFKVPMLCLSQISNEQAKDMNPFIMSTKGAGDIAASADWVLLLQNAEQDMEIINKLKDEKIPLPIKCFIQKHRHGPTGMLSLNFETITGRFLDKNTYDESRYKNKLIQIHGSQSEFALQKEFEDFS